MKLKAMFEEDGFCLVHNVLDDERVAACCEELDRHTENVGTRNLLRHDYFIDLACALGRRVEFAEILKEKIPIQGTVFIKTKARNWGVKLHQDLMVPMSGEGCWPRQSTKEGVPFVRPDPEFMDQLVALRINLDSASDGDLEVVRGSHRHSEKPLRREAQVLSLTKGDVFVMKPLLFHASSKLKTSTSRRVLHFVYGPAELPRGHAWPFEA